ncbi:hypothetical protein B7P43_G18375, partial [Cryptotermes secundus]
YFFIQSNSNDKAVCMLYKDNVAVLKEYNIRHHYDTKHASTFSQFKEKQRSDKFESLRRLCSQQDLFTKATPENEALTLVSYNVTYVLAKKGKPFTDGNIIKECMMEAVTELCPEKLNLFKMISFAPNNVARRIENMGNNTSQPLVFFCVVDDELNVTQELASLHSIYGTFHHSH